MLINNKHYRSIWISEDKKSVEIIDQRYLPFEFIIESIDTPTDMALAIKEMHLRGAPLIGVAAAYGLYLACLEAHNRDDFDIYIKNSAIILEKSRPTAVNLKWAIDRVLKELSKFSTIGEKISAAYRMAETMADEDVEICKSIGEHGVKIIADIYEKTKKTVNILTHCNAGSLACVDFGTATSVMYEAKRKEIPIHVWVSETRPRNQGKLTSWELEQNHISNTIICDNAAGHLMQNGMVDMVIVGTDRTTKNGDVANKIGTYLKALAAKDNNIPFYVALPSSSVDFNMESGKSIPIETRCESEVLTIDGLKENKVETVRVFSLYAKASNYGFDVTPSKLITEFITEKGICNPGNLYDFLK